MTSKSHVKGSPFGVIGYLANFYGMTSSDDLLNRLNIQHTGKSASVDAAHFESVVADDVVKSDMSYYLPDLEIESFVKPEQAINVFRKSKNIKVCKTCLFEGIPHQDEWQLVYMTYCDKHNTELLDSCKHIYSDDGWPEKLRCKACVSPVEPSQPPLFHSHLNDLLSKNQDEAYSFIFCLFRLAERLFRPFDFVAAKVKWEVLSTKEVTELLEDAFILATSPNTFKIWQYETLKHRRDALSYWDDSTVGFGLQELQSTLAQCDWQIEQIVDFDIKQILTKYHGTLNINYQTNRAHLMGQSNCDDVSFTITTQILADLIDVDSTGLDKLHRCGVLSAVRGNVRLERMSWDIRTVIQEVKSIFNHEIIMGFEAASIRDADVKVLDALLINTQKVTLSLLNKELKGYITIAATDLPAMRTLLDVDSMKAMYEKELSNIEHLTLRDASRLLGVTVPFIEVLVKTGILSYARWQRGTEYLIDKTSMQHLLKEYISINREALLDGVEVQQRLKKVTDCCGLAPHIIQMSHRNNTPLYLFKVDEMNACCHQQALSSLAAIRVERTELSGQIKYFCNMS